MSRILVVDDAAFMRMSIRNMLTKNGFEIVDEAENGEVAIQKYEEHKPDLVTLDITMPKMDGIEALKGILKNNPKAKVIMLSALGQESKVREAITSGAKSFIVKPFKEEVLVNSIKKVLSM